MNEIKIVESYYPYNDIKISYRVDQITRDRVHRRLVDFAKRNRCFSGEDLYQRDISQIEALELVVAMLQADLQSKYEEVENNE